MSLLRNGSNSRKASHVLGAWSTSNCAVNAYGPAVILTVSDEDFFTSYPCYGLTGYRRGEAKVWVFGRSCGFVVFIHFKNPNIGSNDNITVDPDWLVNESVCVGDILWYPGGICDEYLGLADASRIPEDVAARRVTSMVFEQTGAWARVRFAFRASCPARYPYSLRGLK